MLMAACVSPAFLKTRILVLSIDVERPSKFEMIRKEVRLVISRDER